MDRPHSVHPLCLHGHLGCFHLLAIANTGAVNMEVQMEEHYFDGSEFSLTQTEANVMSTSNITDVNA
jgi:hypothetical protein